MKLSGRSTLPGLTYSIAVDHTQMSHREVALFVYGVGSMASSNIQVEECLRSVQDSAEVQSQWGRCSTIDSTHIRDTLYSYNRAAWSRL